VGSNLRGSDTVSPERLVSQGVSGFGIGRRPSVIASGRKKLGAPPDGKLMLSTEIRHAESGTGQFTIRAKSMSKEVLQSVSSVDFVRRIKELDAEMLQAYQKSDMQRWQALNLEMQRVLLAWMEWDVETGKADAYTRAMIEPQRRAIAALERQDWKAYGAAKAEVSKLHDERRMAERKA
jgi:hypothetical protein